MAKFSFNANEAPEMTIPKRGPLPPGDYEVIVTRSEIRRTQSGSGEYISLEMQVVDGEHSGRRLWENLNVNNPNKQAEDIAKAALGAICNAVGVTNLEDTEQLHDIPLVATVVVDKKDPTRNRVVGYAPAMSAPPKPAVAPKPAANGARPWQR